MLRAFSIEIGDDYVRGRLGKGAGDSSAYPAAGASNDGYLAVRSIRLGVSTNSLRLGHDQGIGGESDGSHGDSSLFSVGNHSERACRFDGPKRKLLDLARGAVFLEDLETIFPMGEILARMKSP